MRLVYSVLSVLLLPLVLPGASAVGDIVDTCGESQSPCFEAGSNDGYGCPADRPVVCIEEGQNEPGWTHPGRTEICVYTGYLTEFSDDGYWACVVAGIGDPNIMPAVMGLKETAEQRIEPFLELLQ